MTIYEWASLLVVPVGMLGTLVVLVVRNRLGYEHWRMYCPRTAYPYPPKSCTCRCRTCRDRCQRADLIRR